VQKRLQACFSRGIINPNNREAIMIATLSLRALPLAIAAAAIILPVSAGMGRTPPGRTSGPSLADSSTVTTMATSKPVTTRPAPSTEQLEAAIKVLAPLHTTLGKPRPHDWLEQHPEPGQSFAEYLKCNPTLPEGKRVALYIQPLGDFTPKQRQIIELTARFMGLYYNLEVRISPGLPLSIVPTAAQRVHPEWGDKQILTSYVLDTLLKPRLPSDAVVFICFTSSDLWPGKGWNFVFGQASLTGRVGVWSIYRNGDPDTSEAAFRLCLLRTMKTAVHETGHMFSMRHCTAYECCMCGSNNRSESDRRPLWLCPQCMAKVCWAMKIDPAERYRMLAKFCRDVGLKAEAGFYEKSAAAREAK
jgi:archaemetzincin